MTLRIRLLGGFVLEKGGSPVALPARKSDALLSVLALRPGVSYTREWLAVLLWPEVPETQARTSLRQAVGHLRKHLGEELIAGGTDRVHLEPGAAWVDTAEAERIALRPASEREPLAELFSGVLLAGFPAVEEPFDDWLRDERARLSERLSARLEECLAALAAGDHVERAIAVGSKLVDVEPTREAVHRALMRLHARRGDRAAAVRQYERCREQLERRLAIAPSRETEELRARVAAATNAPAAPSASTGEPVARPELDGRVTLAVLPFRVEGDAGLLASGLVEEVTTELGRFRELALLARQSVADIASRTTNVEAFGRELGARLVLSGSVFVAGSRARITAALTDTTTGLEIWAERWDAAHDDPLGAIDRLTKSLVSALALRIDDTRLGKARERPRERLDAYECWLRGVECLRRGTPESDDEARGLFERALELEPSFARAHSGISLSHFNDWSCQAWDRWDERERLSFESARRAVELDDDDHVTHTILARIHVYRGEFELAERHVERALALNSSDANMLVHGALVLAQLGEATRACELTASALALNPKRPDWYFLAASFTRLFAREPQASLELGLRAPDALVDARAHLACACAHLGDEGSAREHLQKFIANFREKIVVSRDPEPGEPARWLLHVTAFRRQSDRDYLLDGLARAGLALP